MLWSFFDFLFSFASLLLAIFFGAAIGNVVRGVPLAADGYFFEALWTNFRVGMYPGILDWYTVLTGVLALVTLAVHGAHYVALKTEGDIQARSRRVLCPPGIRRRPRPRRGIARSPRGARTGPVP